MANISALNIDGLIDYFKRQKQLINKKYYIGTDTLDTLAMYKKIISDIKNIDPKLNLDFRFVTKNTNKGSKQILYTSKKAMNDRFYQSEYQFLVTKDNKLNRIDSYRDIHDKAKPFLREAGARDLMLLDKNIVHALTKIINNRS